MRRHLLTSAAFALVASAPVVGAQEGGPIRTGEHGAFSRVVLTIAPTTPWSVEQTGREAVIGFPGSRIGFTTEEAWRRISRERVSRIVPERSVDGTAIRLTLACDCHVAAALVDGRYLAVDVHDEPPAAEAAATRDAAAREALAARSAAALDAAERTLLAQLDRAASQGLVEITDPEALAALREAHAEEAARAEAAVAPSPGSPVDAGAAARATAAGRTAENSAPAADAATTNAPAADAATTSGLASGGAANGARATDAATRSGSAADAPSGAPATRSEAPLRPAPRPSRPAEVAIVEDDLLLAHLGIARSGEQQVRATTAVDRDAPRDPLAAQASAECLPGAAFDLARWSDGRPLNDQAVEVRRLLVGEFDRPNAAAVRDLARLHIRHGLGAEAGAILRSLPAAIEDAELLADLARVVETRAPDGPLARDLACPGRHGLWLAIAGGSRMLGEDALFGSIREAFEELPLDLRTMVAPDLVERLAEAGKITHAGIIRDVALRPGQAPDRAMQLAMGRLAAAERRLDEAEAWFGGLVETGAANAPDAALGLVRARLEAGGSIPAAWITDLQALAVEQRRGAREVEARALLAESLARNGELRGAMDGLAGLAEDRPDALARVQSLAPRLLREAEPEEVGRATFAEVALGHAHLMPLSAAADPARAEIAEKLVGIGLANAAPDLLAPAIARGAEPVLMAAARAHLALGEGEMALARLAPLQSEAAAGARARALAMTGDFAAATEAATEAKTMADMKAANVAASEAARPRPIEAILPYSWAAGAWDLAAASDDPEQAAMALYMRDRGNAASEAVGPSRGAETARDAETPGEAEARSEAFQRPLPNLGAPSLSAGRGLVETGAEVRAFLEGLLAPRE